MSNTQYRYARLRQDIREIRLVSLLPGLWDDLISCVTRIVSLDQKPYYEALSYVWGDLDAVVPIFLDGHSFLITPNLESALRHLRHADKPRVLWVDTLCIDQNSNEEKSWQVNLMGAIFENCAVGLMWLGNATEDTDLCYDDDRAFQCAIQSQDCVKPGVKLYQPDMRKAINLIEDLSRGEHLERVENLRGLFDTQGDHHIQAAEPIYALGALIRRTWWSRIWTVQEAILPRTAIVLCGPLSIPWHKIAQARVHWFQHKNSCCLAATSQLSRSLGNTAFEILAHWSSATLAIQSYRMRRARGATLDLVEVLNAFDRRKAKDPRDKVYALLGLIEEQRRPVFPDYSVDVDQLSRSLTLGLFASSREPLSVFNGVRRPRSGTGLPSWIRDFGNRSGVDRLPYERNRDTVRRKYRASRFTAGRAQLCSDTVLSLVGVKVDRISQIGSICTGTVKLEPDHISQWAELLNLDSRLNEPYVAGGTLEEAFMRTMMGDFVMEMLPEGDTPQRLLGFYRKTSPEELEDYKKHLRAAISDGHQHQAHKFDREVMIHLASRRFFITQGGFLGIGPPQILQGDEVFVLFGGNVPYVLRSSNDAFDFAFAHGTKMLPYYTLIGDCYVHGVMDGEVIDDSTKESLVFLR